jgi:small subunit ribosomal protein S11
MPKKVQTRSVDTGRIYITATFNNTIITITDEKGNPLVIGSCGMHGFTGTRKSTPHAATITVDASIRKAITNYNLTSVDVYVKGIGQGREASLRAIKASDLDVQRIVDITPVPHNGVRALKIRRV